MYDLCTFHLIIFFFFNDTATTEIYTLSLHDALPILSQNTLEKLLEQRLRKAGVTVHWNHRLDGFEPKESTVVAHVDKLDRKSTRLNSSHLGISYAVFCLKKKKNKRKNKTNRHITVI